MNEPITTIDPRFSDPDTVATSWDETRRLLETAELFWVVTVRTDSRPHVTPLVAVWLDEALHFCTAETEQKAVNLRKNPHVILAAGSIHWDAGIDVVVEGDAVQVTDEDQLKRLASAWTSKWDGRWQYEVRNGAFHNEEATIPVFSVTPTKVFAYAEGTFSQTRHQF